MVVCGASERPGNVRVHKTPRVRWLVGRTGVGEVRCVGRAAMDARVRLAALVAYASVGIYNGEICPNINFKE